jgi:hypothetical protein
MPAVWARARADAPLALTATSRGWPGTLTRESVTDVAFEALHRTIPRATA